MSADKRGQQPRTNADLLLGSDARLPNEPTWLLRKSNSKKKHAEVAEWPEGAEKSTGCFLRLLPILPILRVFLLLDFAMMPVGSLGTKA